jgi:membrane fusion protein (multidrug efflux system)
MMKTKLLLCVTVLLAGMFAGCKPAAEESEGKIVTEVAVRVGKVTRTTLRRLVTAYGVVEPEPAGNGQPGAGARLAPPVASVVAEVNCAEGQRVEKGAVLFRLDSRVADVAVESAKQNYERLEKLMPAGGTSRKAVQEAEQQLAGAHAQQSLLTIAAPMAGIITRVNARPGEAVDLTSVLGELVDLDRLVVTANVPAAETDGLKAGQSVELIVEDKPLPVRGAVMFVSPQIETKTGTALVRVSVPAGAGLRAGQSVNLRIACEERADRLAVPRASVLTDEDGHTLVAIVEGDKAKQVPVKTGLHDGALVEVEGVGVKEGALVVTEGAYGLPKETKVRVLGE